jgi:gas vesicle protein
MAATARKFELEPPMHEQTVLEVNVNHLQEDVTGLKADFKRMDTKIDAIGASLTEHRLETERSIGKLRHEMKDAIGTVREEMKDSIAAVRDEMKGAIAAVRDELKDSIATLRGETKESIAELRNDMTASIGALRVEMRDSFAKFRSSNISHLAWMVSTLIAATGVAFTVAKFLASP